MPPPNFTPLDPALPGVLELMQAMLAARDAVERWSAQESEAWWADVLADPRAGRTRTAAAAVAHDACQLLPGEVATRRSCEDTHQEACRERLYGLIRYRSKCGRAS